MQHSIAAKYVARTAARYVRPSATSRDRRLGLKAASPAQPATPLHPTALGRADLGPFVRMHARWRAIRPAVAAHRLGGTLRRRTRMTWSGASREGITRRSRTTPSSWAG